MKKLLQVLLITSLFLLMPNVKAEEIFFTNKNNVSFTRFQYDTLVNAMGLYGVLNMDQESYEIFEVDAMMEDNTNIEVLEDYDVVDENENLGISTLDDNRYNETNYKILTGITTCASGKEYCTLNIILEWKKNPSTRSYDVIGTLIFNSSFYDDYSVVTAFMNNSSKTITPQKATSSGRAAAIKLSSSGNIDSFILTTKLTKSGRAQVSYQHAVKEVTQFTALNFSFNSAGMGGVFAYPDRYVGNYDDMAGLSLKVS